MIIAIMIYIYIYDTRYSILIHYDYYDQYDYKPITKNMDYIIHYYYFPVSTQMYTIMIIMIIDHSGNNNILETYTIGISMQT